MPRGIYPGNKGRIPWNRGLKASPETLVRMSAASKRRGAITEETRQKLRDCHKGKKHWNWKGGVSPLNKRIRVSSEYRIWRENVFRRDAYTCVLCGARNGNGRSVVLNADHIKPFCGFPNLRFEISNGRTLCIGCHAKTDTYKGKSNKGKKYRCHGSHKCTEANSS